MAMLLALWAAASAAQPLPACEDARAILQARRIVTQQGLLLSDAVVALPDRLPRSWRDERVQIVYQLDVPACAGTSDQVLWLPRVGAAFTVRAQGQHLRLLIGSRHLGRQPEDASSPPVYNGRMATLFALPANTHSVQLRLAAVPYMATGLLPARSGSDGQLLAPAVSAVYASSVVMNIATAVLLLITAVALLLWLRHLHEVGFLAMLLVAGWWATRAQLYSNSMLPMAPDWFDSFNRLNVLLTVATLQAAILWQLAPEEPTARRRWLEAPLRILLAATLAGAGAMAGALALGSGGLLARDFSDLCAMGLGLWLGWTVTTATGRFNGWRRTAMIGGYAGFLGSAVHDTGILNGALDPGAPMLLFWGVGLVLLIYAALTGDHIVRALQRAKDPSLELELELERRSALRYTELGEKYARLRDTERLVANAAGRQDERHRILRDMHDGLGGQLLSLLRGVERNALSPEQLRRSISDSLSELRMLMDNAALDAELETTLANWCERWDAALAALGIAMVYEPSGQLADLHIDSATQRQLMHMLQEAATNVVKHAQATSLRLVVRVYQPADGSRLLQLELTDNGRGLGSGASRKGQHGLRNMRRRAHAIGAQLSVRTLVAPAQGCRVSLQLPLAAPVTAQAPWPERVLSPPNPA